MERYCSHLLLVTISALVALGLVVLFGSGQLNTYGESAIFKRQLGWLIIAVTLCAVVSAVNYRFWMKVVWLGFGLSIVLLCLCFVPQIGIELNGSNRWINLAGVQFQPSEFAKLAVVLVLAFWYHRFADRTGTFLFGFFIPGLLVAIPIILIAIEVDIGGAAMTAGAVVVVMLMAGVSYVWLIGFGVAGLTAVAIGALKFRSNRLLAFTDLEAHASTDGYQQLRGLEALGSGGWSGIGLGNSAEQLKYIPHGGSDFILTLIGGEMGLQVTLLVVLAYLLLLICGVTIALCAQTRFGMLVASGVVALLLIQAVIHMGVTTALLPNKGVPLPFVSHGGSNLVGSFIGIGLLLGIHRETIRLRSYAKPQVTQVRITPAL